MKIGDFVKNTYLSCGKYRDNPDFVDASPTNAAEAISTGVVIDNDGTGYYDVLTLSGKIQRWYEKELKIISE